MVAAYRRAKNVYPIETAYGNFVLYILFPEKSPPSHMEFIQMGNASLRLNSQKRSKMYELVFHWMAKDWEKLCIVKLLWVDRKQTYFPHFMSFHRNDN